MRSGVGYDQQASQLGRNSRPVMGQRRSRNNSPTMSVFSRAKVVDKVEQGWSFFDDCLVNAQLNLMSAKMCFSLSDHKKGDDHLVNIGNGVVVNL